MRCRTTNLLSYWGPPIIYELFIFYLSSRPPPKITPSITHIDKFFHLIIYLIFALILWRAFLYASNEFFKKRAGFFALILTVLFGISDEWHQLFVPLRNPELLDIIFDAIGASIGILLLYIYRNGKKRVNQTDI